MSFDFGVVVVFRETAFICAWVLLFRNWFLRALCLGCYLFDSYHRIFFWWWCLSPSSSSLLSFGVYIRLDGWIFDGKRDGRAWQWVLFFLLYFRCLSYQFFPILSIILVMAAIVVHHIGCCCVAPSKNLFHSSFASHFPFFFFLLRFVFCCDHWMCFRYVTVFFPALGCGSKMANGKYQTFTDAYTNPKWKTNDKILR